VIDALDLIVGLVRASMNEEEGAVSVLTDYLEDIGVLPRIARVIFERAAREPHYARRLLDRAPQDTTNVIAVDDIGLLLCPRYRLAGVAPIPPSDYGGTFTGRHRGYSVSLVRPEELVEGIELDD